MKKIFLTTILSFLIAIPVAFSADTLFQFYSERGQPLPPISERPYEKIGIENPTGTLQENIALLDYLQGNQSDSFGITIPSLVALFETSLQSKITASATSMTLVSGTTKNGTTLSGTYGFIIDEGSADEEFVLGTCADTACTSLTRGISVLDGKTSVYSLIQPHRRGASVKITNYPQLAILTRILNGDENMPNILFYQNDQVGTDFTATNTAIMSKAYMDSLAIAGSPTSTFAQIGMTWLGTRTEIAAGTASSTTGAPLVIPSIMATSTPSENVGKQVVISESDGKLNQLWLDLTEGYDSSANSTSTGNATTSGPILFSGDTTITGTSTQATTTVNRLVINDELIFNGEATVIRGLSRLATSTTASTTVADSAAETTLFSWTVPAGALGTDGVIKVRLNIDDVDSTAGHNPTYKLKYGATTLVSFSTTMPAAANYTGYIDITLIAANATDSQKGNLYFCIGNTGSTINMGGGHGVSSIDSTVEQTLTTTITVGSADATDSLTVGSAFVEILD